MIRSVISLLSVSLMILGAGAVSGQDYPNKLIRIVTAGIGSGADVVSRLVAQGIAGPLGQPVVIENRSGFAQIETALKAPPDGYTLLTSGSGFWIDAVTRTASYDPVKDFAPISILGRAPYILVVT